MVIPFFKKEDIRMATKKAKTTKKSTKKQVDETKEKKQEQSKSTSDNFVNFHLKKGKFRELTINEKQFASILLPGTPEQVYESFLLPMSLVRKASYYSDKNPVYNVGIPKDWEIQVRSEEFNPNTNEYTILKEYKVSPIDIASKFAKKPEMVKFSVSKKQIIQNGILRNEKEYSKLLLPQNTAIGGGTFEIKSSLLIPNPNNENRMIVMLPPQNSITVTRMVDQGDGTKIPIEVQHDPKDIQQAYVDGRKNFINQMKEKVQSITPTAEAEEEEPEL